MSVKVRVTRCDCDDTAVHRRAVTLCTVTALYSPVKAQTCDDTAVQRRAVTLCTVTAFYSPVKAQTCRCDRNLPKRPNTAKTAASHSDRLTSN